MSVDLGSLLKPSWQRLVASALAIAPMLLVFTLLATGPVAQAQDRPDTVAATAIDTTAGGWELTPSLLTILYTDTIALWNPAITADHGKLHLEARYQWEDWNTASVWVGYNFGFGEALHVDLTPMAGAVFGNINGVAPGILVEAEWRSLSFYSSSEHLDHLIIGIVAQRTRTFQSPLDLQRGLLLMREQGNLTFGMYLFNIGWTDPTVAFTLSYGFGTNRRKTP
jgi:hypothetical protein